VLPRSLVVKECKKFILADWPAQCSTKLIPVNRGHAGWLIEGVPGLENVIPEEFERRPMVLVGPDFVSTWMTTPPACENSGSKLLVVALNPCTESMGGLIVIIPKTGSVLSMPSIMKFVPLKSCPFVLT